MPRLERLEDRTLLSTLTVTSSADSGPGSLRDAIAAASPGTRIVFADDVHEITLTSGELQITKSLDIEGPGAQELTISGDHAGRVFDIAGGADVTLSGLTIADDVAVQGGGIDNHGTLSVILCVLINNEAVGGSGDSTTPDAANGGGIVNEVGAHLSLLHSLLTDNTAAASPGEDAFGGGVLNLGSATVAACAFTANQVTGGGSSSSYDGSYGGAIESFLGSLGVAGSTFVGNQATGAGGPLAGVGVGGALDLEDGTATVTDTAFTDNLVTTSAPATVGAGGGAIDVTNAAGSASLTVTDSTFTGNQAVGGGGAEGFGGGIATNAGTAVMNLAGVTVDISHCRFTGNLAQGGTGVAGIGGAIDNPGSTMTVTDSILSGNRAIGGDGTGAPTAFANRGAGGGIANRFGGNLTIIDSTLIGNQALGGNGNAFNPKLPFSNLNGFAVGGGIENRGSTLTVVDSALIGNLAQGGTNATAGINGAGQGGGINNEKSSTLTLLRSILADNQARGAAGASGVAAGDGLGGGLVDAFQSTATVMSILFVGNVAQGGPGFAGASGGDGLGGAIAVSLGSVLGGPDSSSLTLTGSALIANLAIGGVGGAEANGGNGLGGGAFIGAGGDATLADTIVIANQALGGLAGSGGSDGDGIGGGIYALGMFSFDSTSVIKRNRASTSNPNTYP